MRLIEYYPAIQILSRSVEPLRTSSDFKFYSYDVITQGQGRKIPLQANQVLSRSVEPSRTSSDFKLYSYDVITEGQGRNRIIGDRATVGLGELYHHAKFRINRLNRLGDRKKLNC